MNCLSCQHENCPHCWTLMWWWQKNGNDNRYGGDNDGWNSKRFVFLIPLAFSFLPAVLLLFTVLFLLLGYMFSRLHVNLFRSALCVHMCICSVCATVSPAHPFLPPCICVRLDTHTHTHTQYAYYKLSLSFHFRVSFVLTNYHFTASAPAHT